MSSSGIPTIEIVILTLVAVAILLQVGLVLVILIAMGKATRVIKDEIADVRSSVMPLIYDTRELLTNLSPKIESTADDLSVILHGFRSQSEAICSASAELIERLRRQSGRLEGMLSGVMDRADRTSAVVTDTVGKPVRQIAGLVASAKAIVEALRSPRSTVRNRHSASSTLRSDPSTPNPAPSTPNPGQSTSNSAPSASQEQDGHDLFV
jgi:methyl-accepting chemotaxis protein